MDNFNIEHRLLNWIEHLWPYISGLVVTIVAAIRLWWYDRGKLKKQINDNSTLVGHITECMVTHEDLIECRDSVDEQDADNLKNVLNEIKTLRQEIKNDTEKNSQQHLDILHKMTSLNHD